MNVELYGNLTGFKGTERTIHHMRRLVQEGKADPVVIFKAQQIVKNIDRNNWFRIGTALHNWVKKNIRYVRDPNGVELVKSPRITMRTGVGDCDDQAILWSAMAESVGMRTRFKTVKANPRYPDEFSHVYSQGYVPGRGWLAADTIVTHARFGDDVASKFASKEWKGNSSMNGASITAGEIAGLGEIIFANDQTFEDPDNGAFGEYRGNQWDNFPSMVGRNETTDAFTDTDDFWSGGGGADIDQGPPLKQSMLPAGVGAMNSIGEINSPYTSRDYVDVETPMDGMGDMYGWNPFKKVAKWWTKKVRDPIVKSVRQGKVFGMKLWSTRESQGKARRKAMEGTFGPLYNSDVINLLKTLINRVEETLVKLKIGEQPNNIVRPPTSETSSDPRFAARAGATQGVVFNRAGRRGAIDITIGGRKFKVPASVMQVNVSNMPVPPSPIARGLATKAFSWRRDMNAGAIVGSNVWLYGITSKPEVLTAMGGMGALSGTVVADVWNATPYGQITSIIGSFGEAKDRDEAIKRVTKRKATFDSDVMPKLQQAFQKLNQMFISAGGNAPVPGDKPDSNWLNKFEEQVRKKKGNKDGEDGWAWHYLNALAERAENAMPGMQQAIKMLAVTHATKNEALGADTLAASAKVVQRAVAAGAIRPDEVQAALNVTNRAAMGYKLTPQEQELASRIGKAVGVAGAVPKSVWYAIPAAAAAFAVSIAL